MDNGKSPRDFNKRKRKYKKRKKKTKLPKAILILRDFLKENWFVCYSCKEWVLGKQLRCFYNNGELNYISRLIRSKMRIGEFKTKLRNSFVVCKRCTAETKKNDSKIHRLRRWYKDKKKGLKCNNCGEAAVECLDFHHKNPKSKISSISYMVNRLYNIEEIEAEMQKCVVLCSNCHKKTHGKTNKLPTKGASHLRRVIIEIKNAAACAACGENNAYCLEFHHLDPSQKKFGIAQLSKEKITEEQLRTEVAKCKILCSNCHRKEHKHHSK